MSVGRLGGYDLVARLASGGMAEIYAARSERHEMVIVKQMLPQFSDNPDFVEMFLDEGRTMSLLRHPNVVRMHDFGYQGDTPFLAMEYLHGVDLRTFARTTRERKLQIPYEVTLAIVAAICAGLHHAHEARTLDGHPMEIVHRDVSPQNVLLTFEGEIKVIDFGIAKSRGQLHETRAGAIKGKVPYMAPEQVRGVEVDRRTDVYAVGVILYELLLARRPYVVERGSVPGGEFSLMMAIVNNKIQAPLAVRPELPPELAALTLRALAGRPDDRFPTALALQLEVERIARTLGPPVGPAALAAMLRELFGTLHERWRSALDDEVATEIASVMSLRAPTDDELHTVIEVEPPQDLVEAPVVPSRGIEKHVDAQRTRITITRAPDPAFRWPRLFEGVEGVVEIDLATTRLDDRAIAALAHALRSLGPEVRAIVVLGTPLALAERIGTLPRMNLRSITLEARCPACAVPRAVSVTPAELAAAREGRRARLTCPRCSGALELPFVTPAVRPRSSRVPLVTALLIILAAFVAWRGLS